MSVFLAYSDESGPGDGAGPFLVGGCADYENEWKHFARDWFEQVLSQPKIPYLHVKEIRREKWRQERGLTNVQAEMKIEIATELIARRPTPKAISSVIRIDDLDRFKGRLKERDIRGSRMYLLREPDYLCFLAFVYPILRLVKDTFPDVTRVDFVVSHKNKVSENIREWKPEIVTAIQKLVPELESLMGEVIPSDMRDTFPLQAADVISWHKRRFLESGIVDENCKRIQNKSVAEFHWAPFLDDLVEWFSTPGHSEPSS